jgi:hypothetical protein
MHTEMQARARISGGDLMRARHRLSKLLLRHDVRYPESTSAGTERHRAWLANLAQGRAARRAILTHYVGESRR